MTDLLTPRPGTGLDRVVRRRTRVGLVPAGSVRTGRSSPTCCRSCSAPRDGSPNGSPRSDCEVVDVGFISDAPDGAAAAEQLRLADCDLIVGFLTTYMTASMLVPVAQRSGAPVLLLNLQPTEAMDHASFDTGAWLAYCGACPLPEMANAFARCGMDFRSVSGLRRGRAGLGRGSSAGSRRPGSGRRSGTGGTG